MGITLALFIVMQAGSGLIMSVEPNRLRSHDHAAPIAHDHETHNANWRNSLRDIHHGGGAAGNIYRILVGLGTLGMAFSGATIFFSMNSRLKNRNPS